MQGTLEQLPAWVIVLITPLVFCIYLAGLISSKVRSASEKNLKAIVETLPGFDEILTLLGLVIAALAILASEPQADVNKFSAILTFLGGVVIFTFLYILLSSFTQLEPTYLAMASISSIWYCIGLSFFALFDVLLPGKKGRFLLLLAPLIMVVYSLSSLHKMIWPKS